MWNVATTHEFDIWFEDLGRTAEGRAARVELAALVRNLQAFGPRLARPHADTLTGSKYANLKELRCKTAGMVLRVAFAFDPLQTGILLAGGDKHGVNEKRFYDTLIDRAERLYDRHLESIAPQIAARRGARPKSKRKGR